MPLSCDVLTQPWVKLEVHRLGHKVDQASAGNGPLLIRQRVLMGNQEQKPVNQVEHVTITCCMACEGRQGFRDLKVADLQKCGPVRLRS